MVDAFAGDLAAKDRPSAAWMIEFGGSKGERSSAEKAAAVMVDGLVHINVHG